MVGKMKIICLLLMAILFSVEGRGQDYRANVSLAYGVPTFGTFFQDGYESRLGACLTGVNHRTEDFNVGANFETINFVPYVDNPISIYKANFYALTFRLGYNFLGASANRLEPLIETGYYLFRYNDGDFTGQSFGLGIGADYFYYIEQNYGLSFGLKWTNIFDKFGKDQNPNDVQQAQIIVLLLGLAFDF